MNPTLIKLVQMINFQSKFTQIKKNYLLKWDYLM